MHYDAIYVEKKLLHVSLLLKKYLERYYISMFFDNTMIKKYMIKLNINSHCGNLFIYYKPTTNTYTLVKNLKKNTENINHNIDKAWDSITNAYVYPNTFGIYESFVDGSFFNGIVGYGAMIYLGDRIKKTIYGSIVKDEILVHRQFVGELQAVIETIKWCIWNKITKIRINYDYIGIECFVTGKWKPKTSFSKYYRNFIVNSNINIEWRHIKSHSGNIKNTLVDQLIKNYLRQKCIK